MIRKIRSRVVGLVHKANEALEARHLVRVLRQELAGATAKDLIERGTANSAQLERRLTQALVRIGVMVSPKDAPALYRDIERCLGISSHAAKKMPWMNAEVPIEGLQILEDWNTLDEDLRIVHRGTYNLSGDHAEATLDDVNGRRVPDSVTVLFLLREQPFFVRFRRYSSRPDTEWQLTISGPSEAATMGFHRDILSRTHVLLRARFQGKTLNAELQTVELKTCTRAELIYPPGLDRAIDELLATFHGWCTHAKIRRWGYILIGPRGTGKTTIGGLIARERPADCTFLYCPAGDIGDPEDIKRLFAVARMFAPAVVQIDDVDLISPDRRGGKKEFTSALMEQLDGLREDERIFTLFTTNDPEGMDDAIINRAGRVSGKIVFGGFEECLAPLIRRYAAEYQLRIPDRDVDTAAAASAPKVVGITPDEVKNVCQRLSLLHGTECAVGAEELAETIVCVFTMFHDPRFQASQLPTTKHGNGTDEEMDDGDDGESFSIGDLE